MVIAVAQVNPTVGDLAGNVEKLLDFALRAETAGAQLVLFPELSICGYPPRDLVQCNGFAEDNCRALRQLARRLPKKMAAVVGRVARSPHTAGKPFANTASVLQDGEVVYEQAKILLPTYDVFDEQRNFEPGGKPRVIRLNGVRLGITVCEDCWNDKNFWKRPLYRRDPVEEIASRNPDLLVNISASPYAFGKRAFRFRMLQAIARHYRVPVAFVNMVGGNDSLVFDGSSLVLGRNGKLRGQAKSFEEDLIFFDTEEDELTDIHPQPTSEIKAVFDALVLGTRDYCRKCGFEKAVIGLSGGIDSSLVAVIAAHALGPENVIGVSMPGPFSSEGSLRDARQLAENLGLNYEIVPISEKYNAFRKALAPVFRGLAEDVTEENLQARIRGAIVMALSNKFRAIVLSTGNKSELATGYCTLYGDMVGGLAVIADIYKGMVYQLSRWINRDSEVIPQPSLNKPPSAELRPNQTDQDTLPPYDILDQVVRDYVEENASARQIAGKRKLSLELVQGIIQKVNRNEYKRQQAAPNLKIMPKAFGIGRVFPIAQRYRI
jgi:NAD+ synthase/NAD+ synthase (glutamine-hydrolysing)